MQADVASGTAFLEIAGDDGGKDQDMIQRSNGHESGVGNDGGAVKFQLDFGIELEPEMGLFAATYQVPQELLSN